MTDLPWPEGWHRGRLGGRPRAVFGLVLGTGFAIGGTSAFAGGDPVRGGVLVVAAVVALGGAALAWPRTRGRPVLTGGTLRIPVSRALVALVVAVCASLAALALLVASRARNDAPLVAGTALAAFLLLAAGIVVVLRYGRPGRNGLTLSPEGVAYTTSGRSAFLPWDSVEAITAKSLGLRALGPHTPFLTLRANDPAALVAVHAKERARALVRATFGADLAVPVDQLAVDPVVTYWTVRYYAEHPESRAELADGRSLDRVVRRDLR